MPSENASPKRPRTIWTRGSGCAELAHAVGGDKAVRATGDLHESCVEARAELLVTKKVPTKALVSSATPVDFAPDDVKSVVALVSGGPHSMLAARMASWLGESLDVSAELVSGYRIPEEREQAIEVLHRVGPQVPVLPGRIVEAWTAKQLLDEIDDDALLVFGAAGGSWIQRLFLGPGVRLAGGAPVGAVVIRAQPSVVFQTMQEPMYVSPLLNASDARMSTEGSAIPVVAYGRLVGIVRRAVLDAAAANEIVGDLMEPPQFVDPSDGLENVAEIFRTSGMDPVPVCNEDGLLRGVVHATV